VPQVVAQLAVETKEPQSVAWQDVPKDLILWSIPGATTPCSWRRWATIGLILCQGKDRMLAEYSLAGIDKPIGVSSYELTRALPSKLRSVLPTVEEIEAELDEISPKATVEPEAAARSAAQKPAKKSRKPTWKKPPKTE
jgi:YhcG PDDEXK nuclease domain